MEKGKRNSLLTQFQRLLDDLEVLNDEVIRGDISKDLEHFSLLQSDIRVELHI